MTDEREHAAGAPRRVLEWCEDLILAGAWALALVLMLLSGPG